HSSCPSRSLGTRPCLSHPAPRRVDPPTLLARQDQSQEFDGTLRYFYTRHYRCACTVRRYSSRLSRPTVPRGLFTFLYHQSASWPLAESIATVFWRGPSRRCRLTPALPGRAPAV